MRLNSLPENQVAKMSDFLWAELDARGWRRADLAARMTGASPLRNALVARLALDADNTAELGHIVADRIGRALGWPDGQALLDLERARKGARR